MFHFRFFEFQWVPHLVGNKHLSNMFQFFHHDFIPQHDGSTSGLMGRKKPDFWGICMLLGRHDLGRSCVPIAGNPKGQVTPPAAMGRPPWRRALPVGDVPLRLSVGTWVQREKTLHKKHVAICEAGKPTNPKKWNPQKTTNT